MIGQQKRPLEHTVSSQPVKYQKHLDNNLCEAHTRVASLTDGQLEFQHHFSGVSQKSALSPAASCDSIKVFERALGSELCSAHKVKDTLELECGACWNSQEGSIISKGCEAVRTADQPHAHSAKGTTIEGPEEDLRLSPEEAVEAQGTERKADSMGTHLMRGIDDPPPSGSSASLNVKKCRNSGNLEGSTSREPSLPPVGLHQGAPCPSIPGTHENNVEGGAVLATVQKPARHSNCLQPLPVLMSEKIIDLYAMDERVQRCGGYDAVTSEGLWGNISVALGLGSDCGPGLKLIYFKYLKGLERDKGLLVGGDHDNRLMDLVNMRGAVFANEKRLVYEKGESYSLMVGEQFAESEPFHEKSGEKPVNGGISYARRDDHQEVNLSEDETETGSIRSEREVEKFNVCCQADRDQGDSFLGSCSFSQECDEIPVPAFYNCRSLKGHTDHNGTALIKHGREPGNNVEGQGRPDKATLEMDDKSLADTLTWIKRMALEPGNPHMGQGPEGTGQNEKWVAECASRASKVRALLWKRRDDFRPGDGHLHQVKQILAPSLYYEELPRQEHQGLERLRATRERVAHYGSNGTQKPFHESVNVHRGSSSSLNQPQWVGQASHRLPRRSHFYNEERYCEELLDRPRKRIPIGADFQVHVPPGKSADHASSVADSGRAGANGDETQSSDEDDEDDSRWLGKLVWPPPGSKRIAYRDQLWQGRPSFCSCLDPESLDCVRLHILEERDRLKQELGQAFYIWKFDQMGESVADNWSKDEEHTFRALVKMNPPSQDKNFWDQLPEVFPGKKMKELVSYYFNVFVLRRRAIQNRLDSKHVDSDDDETDLPEVNSEDYDSGDEIYEDASEEEDETDKEDGDGPYVGDTSIRLLEDAGFCDLGGVNMVYASKMGVVSTQDEPEGIPLTVCTTRLMDLEDIEHGYHDPHQEERAVRLCTSHMAAKWSHEQHDDEKHLEEHISIVGEKELQEVKTWEASHWDEADHEDLSHNPVAKGVCSKSERLTLCTEGDPSPYKKAMGATNQHNSLGSCEGEVWGTTMDIAPIKERDKLLSTNGMIQEFFGNEASGLNAST